MEMIIGGAFQGKASYAEKMYPGVRWKKGAELSAEELFCAEGVLGFHEFIRREMQAGRETESLAEELIRIGMIEKPEEIIRYYFHGSGHYIGLYTHDVGDDNALLEEDMVFTLEPGLYFDELGIGIRIEDTLVVTKDGCEVLSGGIPKTVEEIEAFMQKS